MQLNHMAGRRRGNASFYPILPWVIDTSTAPECAMYSNTSQAKLDRMNQWLKYAVFYEVYCIAYAQPASQHHRWNQALVCISGPGGLARLDKDKVETEQGG
jgi:hypothetical protein